MNPYNHKIGQKIESDVDGVSVDRGFVAHFQVAAESAVAASDTAVLTAIALTDEIQEITEGITNPAVPRALRIKGNAAGITGDVVITGTNYGDEVITETLSLNGDIAVDGNKAFKTITSITLPIETHAGTDTVSIGFNNKLGLPYKLAHNTVLAAYLNNVLETTVPTVTADVINIENNTINLNSALDDSVVDVYLIV